MIAAVHLPAAGILALSPSALACVLAITSGGRSSAAVAARLAAAGILDDHGLAPDVAAIASVLAGDGPRFRLLSRGRGELTVTDLVCPSDGGPAVVAVRPRGDELVHLRGVTLGTGLRHLARQTGLGRHVLAPPLFDEPVRLSSWAAVRHLVDAPEQVAGRTRVGRVELHQVRWASAPRVAAATAMVLARFDDRVVEVRPDPANPGGFVATVADGRRTWARLCELAAANAA